MKILFISDIHGIYDNIPLIDKELIEDKIDKLVVLGDLYLGGNDRNLIDDFLLKYKDKLICMKGNCDTLSDVYKARFLMIPDISLIAVDGLSIYITHGDKYNIYNNDKIDKGVLVYGHEHYPYIEKEDNMVYINVGSISKPRNGSNASYMIYENHLFTIYDIYGNVLYKQEV